jgi:hypothetical protein
MISNITVSGAAGSYQVSFSTSTPTPGQVYVQVGAAAGAYTETDNGVFNGSAANGVQPCLAFLATTSASFHYCCTAVALDGSLDASADQAFGVPVAVGGGGKGGDGDDDHDKGDDGRGKGDDGHGHGGDDRGRDGDGRGGDGDRGRG